MTKNHSPKNPDHGKLMKLLCERTGKITDGAAQGKAANDLLAGIAENRWTFADIVTELDLQLRDSRTVGNWRHGQRVSYLSVGKVIGTKYDRRMTVGIQTEVEADTLSVDEAHALMCDLNQTDRELYWWHINSIAEQYGFAIPDALTNDNYMEGVAATETAGAVFGEAAPP